MKNSGVKKQFSALRTTVIGLLAACFMFAQGAHAAVATQWTCHLQAIAQSTESGSSHPCGHEQRDSNHGGRDRAGCCCGDSAACGCELNQGRATARQEFPPAISGCWGGHAQIDPDMATSHITVIPQFMEKHPHVSGVQARAPSESIFLSTVRILC